MNTNFSMIGDILYLINLIKLSILGKIWHDAGTPTFFIYFSYYLPLVNILYFEKNA